MIQADGAKCRYGGCSKSNEENEKILSGFKGLILDREFLFEILGCFSDIWIHFPLTKRKENLTIAGLIRTYIARPGQESLHESQNKGQNGKSFIQIFK